MLSSFWVHVREVAFVVGNVLAGASALGEQAVRVCTRALYRDVDKTHTWDWNWESREAELMELADAGSRGPWLLMDEFQMDFDTYAGGRGPWLLEDEFQMGFDSYADILSRYILSTILTHA